MGLYDNLYFAAPGPEALRCAAGHPLTGVAFQTRELDSTMEDFYVVDGRIRAAVDTVERVEGAADEATLVRTTRLRATPLSATLSLEVECQACAPVFVLVGWRFEEPELSAHHPECAFSVRFHRGRLVSCSPVGSQTREALRSALARRFVRVLDDDDPLTVRAMRSWQPGSHPEAPEDSEVDELEEVIDEMERASPGVRLEVEARTELLSLVRAMRRCRKEAGLARAEVARRVGVEAKEIAALEEGDEVRVDILVRYLLVLGVRDLLGRLLDV